MVVRFLHNYVVSGEMVGEEPLFAARCPPRNDGWYSSTTFIPSERSERGNLLTHGGIIREFSEIKEFRAGMRSLNSLNSLNSLIRWPICQMPEP